MIRDFYINDHLWRVRVFLLEPRFDSGPILGLLEALKIKDGDLLIARSLLSSEELNWGFTVSSFGNRFSVVVIGPSENDKECFDTIVHETYHLAKHISQCDGIDPFSEDVAYISGDLAGELYRLWL